MASKTIDDRLVEIESILDTYESSLTLPKVSPPHGLENELNEYLNLRTEHLQRMSIEDTAAVSVRLSQFAFFIQRVLNQESAKLNVMKNILNELTASHWQEYDSYLKAEIKVHVIAKDNPVIKRLLSLINMTQAKIDRISGLQFNINNIANTFTNFQKAKVYQYKNDRGSL